MLPGLFKLLLQGMDTETRDALLRELGLVPAGFVEGRKRQGVIRVMTRNLASGLVTVEVFNNLITNGGKNLDRDSWQGVVTDSKIKYLAVGDGTSAPSASQTTLDNERYRQQMTSYTPGSTGVLTSTCVIGPGAALFHWQELAWFAGASATSAANTGVMVARVLYNHDHSSAESVQVDRQDTES